MGQVENPFDGNLFSSQWKVSFMVSGNFEVFLISGHKISQETRESLLSFYLERRVFL